MQVFYKFNPVGIRAVFGRLYHKPSVRGANIKHPQPVQFYPCNTQ